MTAFGERLRQLRREAGLSQGQLAGDGLSASYISLLEAGKRSPSQEVLSQLAVRLGCSTHQLLDGRPSERDQRIELELAYARLAIEHGEPGDARTRLERLLAEDGTSPRALDDARLLVGMACERSGDLEAAVRVFLPLYERSRKGDTHIPVTLLGLGLCGCYYDSGDLHRATVIGEQALSAAVAQGLTGTDDYFRLAATIMDAYTGLGDFLHARTWAENLIAEAETVGQQVGQAAIYWNAALLAEQEGRLDEALHLCHRAMGHLSEFGDTRDYARLRIDMASILLADMPPKVAEAADVLDRALNDLRDLGSRVDLARWNCVKSALLLYQGDVSGAEGRALHAFELLDDKAPSERSRALIVLSDTLVAQERDEEAADRRALALAELDRAQGGRSISLQWRELADRMADTGDHEGAIRAYQRALNEAGVRDRSSAVRGRVSALRVSAGLSVRHR